MDAYLAIASRRDERRYRSDPLPDACVDADPRCGAALRLGGQPPAVDVRRPVGARAPRAHRGDRVRARQHPRRRARRRDRGLGQGAVRFDAGRAAQNMLLAAWNEGIVVVPERDRATRERLRAALELADDEAVAIVLSFGLPEKPRDVERAQRRGVERAREPQAPRRASSADSIESRASTSGGRRSRRSSSATVARGCSAPRGEIPRRAGGPEAVAEEIARAVARRGRRRPA